MSGKVFLVGAGPGDEGLITVKGLEAIKEADVILYDRLANPSLLEYRQESAELFYVGKKAKHHYKTQDQINQLLIEEAKKGKIVTRLKGGDPFIYGRGGEEGEELVKAGVDFEVVPGITSPIAVPAYAGIPLTHRDYNSSVAFVTGHEDPNKDEPSVDWQQLATSVGNLVILMGVGNLSKIVPELIAGGRNPKTPVALIRWGTRPEQKTLVGTLENIVEKVENDNFKPPAIIVVGEVVNLREDLNWFENKALFSKKIVVTRPTKQAKGFYQALLKEGAEVIKAPAIEIAPPVDYTNLDHSLEQLSTYDWIIFTSINGVKAVMKRLFELGKDVRALAGVKISAIGPKTAAEVESYGLRVDYIPDSYVSESILSGFEGEDLSNKRFLLPRADIAREVLIEGLKDLGAKVNNVVAYRTIPGSGNENLTRRLSEGEVDLLTFTSSSTVHNFIKYLGEDYEELVSDVKVACIGPVTTQTAREYNLNIEIIAKEYTIEGLLAAIKTYYSKKHKFDN
ncbi:uroporphyrinogen-III C-methyltransferase [Orenia marismortui]|uniref:uroporphyrinogen-III C-methyltransferase n=1 Tax=Orenia marismortui TaxID=46469 RepID=UPI000364A2F6|nr:uroporphyrinogen-III C-methyltransferase [Orenia marismortui]